MNPPLPQVPLSPAPLVSPAPPSPDLSAIASATADTLPPRETSPLDITLGAPIPNESAAFAAYHALKEERRTPGTVPPARIPQLRSTLRDYTLTARAYNRPLFAESTQLQRADQARYTQKLLGGLDKLSSALTPEQVKSLDARANLHPDPDAYRARQINRTLLDMAYGKKVKPEAYELARNHYAKTVLGSTTPLDDKAFYAALQGRAQKQQNAEKLLGEKLESLLSDTIAGKQWNIKTYLGEIKDAQPDLDDTTLENIEAELRLKRRQFSELKRTVTPIAQALTIWTLTEGSRSDAVTDDMRLQSSPLPTSKYEAAARFMALTPEQRTMTAAIIAQQVENLPEDQRPASLRAAMAFGDAGEKLLQRVANQIAATYYQAKAEFSEETIRNWIKAAREGDVKTMLLGKTSKPEGDDIVQGSGTLQQLSTRASNDFLRPSDSFAARSGILLAAQIPNTIAASTGVGSVLMGASMAADSYTQARLKQPDADPQKQFAAANISGAAQAVVERIAFKSLAGAVKGTGKLTGFLTGKYGTESALRLAGVTNRFARFAAGAGIGATAITVTEYTEEIAQEFIDTGLQDLATTMSGIDPDTDYLALLKSWDPRGEKGAKTLMALLPLALIGGAGAGFHHFKHGEILLRNRAANTAVGIAPERIDSITKNPDLPAAQAEFQAAFQEGATQKIEEAEATRRAQAAAAFTEYLDGAQELARAAGYEIIAEDTDFAEMSGESRFILRLPEQEPQLFNTQEEAETALKESIEQQIQDAHDVALESLTGSMVDFLQQEYASGQNVQVSQKDFAGDFDTLIKKGLATRESVQARLELFALERGQSLPQLQADSGKVDVRIMARAYAKQLTGGATKYFVDLFQGADPLAAAEDFSETHWQHLLSSGLIDAPTALGWLKEAQEKTGYAYLPSTLTAQTYTPAQRATLIEGLSKASVQYLLGQSTSEQLPEGFRGWIEKMVIAMGQAWTWAKQLLASQKLREAIEGNQLPARFVAELADSVGLNDAARLRRAEAEAEAQAMAEFMGDFPALSTFAKGKLLHPAKAREMNSPFAGELQRIYDHFVSRDRKVKHTKKGVKVDYTERTAAANKFFAPVGEAVNLDDLRQRMTEEGFPNMDTISDMLLQIEEVLSIENYEIYATHSSLAAQNAAAGYGPTFSLAVDNNATIPGMPTSPNDNAASANRDGGNQVPDTTQSVLNVGTLTVEEYQQTVKNFFPDPASIAGAIQQITRLLKRSGISYEQESSRKSQSRYIHITQETEEEINVIYKIRISDHELPDKYSQDWDSQVYVNWGSRTNSLNRYGSEHWYPATIKAIEAANGTLTKKDSQLFAEHLAAQREKNAELTAKQQAAKTAQQQQLSKTQQIAEWAAENMKPTWDKIQRIQASLNETNDYGNVLSGKPRKDAKQELKKAWDKITQEFSTSSPKSPAPPLSPSPTFSLSALTGSPLHTLLAQKAAAGPSERAQIMEGIRTRLQGLEYKLEARGSGELTEMEKQLLGWRARTDLTPEQRERLRIEDALAQVKAVLAAVPVEIRAKIAVPMTRILDAQTDKTTINAFTELIENLDEELEFHLRSEYTEAISRILDVAQPTMSESRQSKGKLIVETNRLIAAINEIMELDALNLAVEISTTESTIAELETKLEGIAEEDAETRAKVQERLDATQERQHLLYHFGGIGSKDSRELAQSHKILRDIYTRGRVARKILDDDRRQWIARMRNDVRNSLDAPRGVSGPAHARATEKKNLAKGYAWNLMSIHNLLQVLFPYSQFAADASQRLITAQRNVTRARLAAKDRFNGFMDATFGTKNQRERNKIIRQLHKRRNWKAQVSEVNQTRTEKLTIDQAQRILAGTMKPGWETERDTMILLQQAWRDYLAKNKRAREATQFIEITRVVSRKPAVALRLSDMDALYVLQLARQEEYIPALTTYGYTKEVIEELRQEIDPRALEFMRFYAREYDENWATMNPTFQALYHMDMPRIRNYAPGAFENMKSGATMSGDPMGDAAPMGAMNFGATKNRRAHRSRPKQYSAHAVYMGHVDRSTYWVEFAEIARDMGMIFRETETRRSLEVKHGPEAAAELLTWLDNIANDGAVDAAARLASNTIAQNVAAGQAIAGLSFNFSVPFKQFGAALGSLWYLSPAQALRAFARVIYRPQTFAHVWKSEAIQQRIREGFSPEDRAMLDAAEISPSELYRLHSIARLPITYADAAFTTISGVIAYDHHYTESRAGGMDHARAHETAMAFMDRVVFLTAQPADTQTKSNWEINAKGFAKLLILFKSDPRKQIGLLLADLAKVKAGNLSKAAIAERLLTQWIAYGLMSYIGGAAFRAIAHDDEDDRPIWDWKELIAAMLIGPVEGAGLIGSVIQAAIKLSTGTRNFTNSNNPLSDSLIRTVATMKDFDPFSMDTVKLLATITQLGSVKNPLFALIPAAMRGAGQIQDALDNLNESEEERINRLSREYAAQQKETAKAEASRIDSLAESGTPLDQIPEEDRQKVEKKRTTAQEKDTVPPLIQSLKKMSERTRQEKINYILEGLPNEDERATFRALLRTHGLIQ